MKHSNTTPLQEALSYKRAELDGTLNHVVTEAGLFEPNGAAGGIGKDELACIESYDTIPAFLMSLVSDSDLWCYVSSYGSLTAGRSDPDHSMFPYVTDDQLLVTGPITGPATWVRVDRPGQPAVLWRPFIDFPAPSGVVRRLFKSTLSDFLRYEEHNLHLGLRFQYTLSSSARFGLVRTSQIENTSPNPCEIALMDGFVNLLPDGASLSVQQRFGCLIDSYTRCEVDVDTGLGIISLSAVISDRPQPAESLTAATVWSRGLPSPGYALSTAQTPDFARTGSIFDEPLVTGRRGAYLVQSVFRLEAGERQSWMHVLDTKQSQAQVVETQQLLREDADPAERVRQSIDLSRERLARFVAAADGQQCSADRAATAHFQASVLFNILRGGVFADGYVVQSADFRKFVGVRNTDVLGRCRATLSALPDRLTLGELGRAVREAADTDLTRLCDEYLPLSLSRRHGDPSRPWNSFKIDAIGPEAVDVLSYQGNWRDIFQNWEALCMSFPEYLEPIIAKFLNASTIDGYNPLRITQDGVEWDRVDPNDPWGNIGYWGDHQIVYLLQLLQLSRAAHPNFLKGWLTHKRFAFANVPYRINTYENLVHDSKQTIEFDAALDKEISDRVARLGSDGKLIVDADHAVCHVSLAQKLLIHALTKICNLVVDGGIWMNTQRPEWNDANNALVGAGVSVVTLCYLRRYIAFCLDLFTQDSFVPLSDALLEWMERVGKVLGDREAILADSLVCDKDRRSLLDDLGRSACGYRSRAYEQSATEPVQVDCWVVRDLFQRSLRFIDHSIRANRRADGLYHSYNLLDLNDTDSAKLSRLSEMLEGQVAVLSCGILSSQESCDLIDSLFASAMYCEQKTTFLLYPERTLPSFLQKNTIEASAIRGNPLALALLGRSDRSIVCQDGDGKYRFSSSLYNASQLSLALDRLSSDPDLALLVATNRELTLDTYEQVFHHHAFTGRSSTMYGYEGIGSIYWHMVSKLMLAAGQCAVKAHDEDSGSRTATALAASYFRIREGMGFNKSPREFGAFPADPYSHSPSHGGARQPGMTGQTKEDILARWCELGVRFGDGCLWFNPALLRRREFSTVQQQWHYIDLHGAKRKLIVPRDGLAFTFCQTPIIYKHLAGPPAIRAVLTDGEVTQIPGNMLSEQLSQSIFARSGVVSSVEVDVSQTHLRFD